MTKTEWNNFDFHNLSFEARNTINKHHWDKSYGFVKDLNVDEIKFINKCLEDEIEYTREELLTISYDKYDDEMYTILLYSIEESIEDKNYMEFKALKQIMERIYYYKNTINIWKNAVKQIAIVYRENKLANEELDLEQYFV